MHLLILKNVCKNENIPGLGVGYDTVKDRERSVSNLKKVIFPSNGDDTE